MPKITYINYAGEGCTIDVPMGWSVMEGAIQNDIEGIVAECRGSCECGTCHVFVDSPWREKIDGPSGMEQDMLEYTAVKRTERSRLSCQIKVSSQCNGLVVHFPERQT